MTGTGLFGQKGLEEEFLFGYIGTQLLFLNI